MAFQVQNITHLLNNKHKFFNTSIMFTFDKKNYTIKPTDTMVLYKNILPKTKMVNLLNF